MTVIRSNQQSPFVAGVQGRAVPRARQSAIMSDHAQAAGPSHRRIGRGPVRKVGRVEVGAMQVTFTRTGERSYSLAAHRPSGDVLHMPRGPGYDPWLPHDVVHFVVERHFEIARGVFGQLAAGGDAGTFFTIPHRRRDPARRLSSRLGALGREDTARSERLTGACMAAWHARRGGRWEFADTVDGDDLTGLPDALLAELEEVATRWHALPVGEALTLAWPERLKIRPGGSARGRRQNRDRDVAARRR